MATRQCIWAISLTLLTGILFVTVYHQEVSILLHSTYSIFFEFMPAQHPPPSTLETTHERIPRIIHQYWQPYNTDTSEEEAGDDTLPEHWRKPVKSWKRLSRYGFKYMRWNEAKLRALIQEHHPWFLGTFDSYPRWTQKVDAGRYLVLYHYGGLYADLDVGLKPRCRKQLEALLKYDLVLARSESFSLAADMMMTAPRHPFFEQILHNMADYNHWYFLPLLTVMFSTGPAFVTVQFTHFPHREDAYVLPTNLYIAGNDSYFFHMKGNTWHEWDAGLLLMVYNKPHFFLLLPALCYAVRWCLKNRSGTGGGGEKKDKRDVEMGQQTEEGEGEGGELLWGSAVKRR